MQIRGTNGFGYDPILFHLKKNNIWPNAQVKKNKNGPQISSF